MLLNVISVLVPVLFVLALGFGALKAKAFKEDVVGVIIDLVLDFALPATLFAGTVSVSRWALVEVKRGELAAFKGAKHVYLDPADLQVVREIDWRHPPAELESAALHSLHQRMLSVLADQPVTVDGGHRACPSSRCAAARPAIADITLPSS